MIKVITVTILDKFGFTSQHLVYASDYHWTNLFQYLKVIPLTNTELNNIKKGVIKVITVTNI
jgi:hypothetical protein